MEPNPKKVMIAGVICEKDSPEAYDLLKGQIKNFFVEQNKERIDVEIEHVSPQFRSDDINVEARVVITTDDGGFALHPNRHADESTFWIQAFPTGRMVVNIEKANIHYEMWIKGEKRNE